MGQNVEYEIFYFPQGATLANHNKDLAYSNNVYNANGNKIIRLSENHSLVWCCYIATKYHRVNVSNMISPVSYTHLTLPTNREV